MPREQYMTAGHKATLEQNVAAAQRSGWKLPPWLFRASMTF